MELPEGSMCPASPGSSTTTAANPALMPWYKIWLQSACPNLLPVAFTAAEAAATPGNELQEVKLIFCMQRSRADDIQPCSSCQEIVWKLPPRKVPHRS